MNITVTQDDIKNGKPNNPLCCPVSLAMGRAFKQKISVVPTDWRFRDKLTYNPLPAIAQEFINNYDNGRKVGPISFEV